ncbi:MAG: 1-acyl-sn-glycerol-3-phosphate acyltransferase [Spirochaetales bacterium]|nr:1-acyl-sn-glycerol-3-phosphate acyltransferase [Spirochaetales bacterium]
MFDQYPHFDMSRRILRMHLRPLIWLLCLPALISHRNHLEKIDMEGIRPPYLLLCNHNAFMDFKVATKAIFPHRANYVVAIDGFLKREWLLRFIGCICKRKFTRDITLVKQLKEVASRGDIPAIYPEARYSLCGTNAVLPASIGKLAKFLGLPVVTLVCHGHHINSPFWNLHDRKVKGTKATMKCLFTEEQLEKATPKEIYDRVNEEFRYDDYAWQKENNIRITYDKRAEGLHKVLYQCPCCGTEYHMRSHDDILECTSCGAQWRMEEDGSLSASGPQAGDGRSAGRPDFTHIPDWYEWERANVRREVEAGTYSFRCTAQEDLLPKDRYIPIGKAELVHDMSGFTLRGRHDDEDYEVKWPASELYSCHIEYDYLGKYGDCVDLNTLNDTFYIYPEDCEFSVTKFALATEELYQHFNAGSVG